MKKILLTKCRCCVLLLSMLVIFNGCSSDSDSDPELKVNTTSLTMSATGVATDDIVVSASETDWSVEVVTGKDWLSAYKNGNKVGLNAKENTTTDDRIGTIVISSTANSSLSATVQVTQEGTKAYIKVAGNPSFPGSFNGKSGIDYKEFVPIKSNVTWTISDIPDWLNVSPTSGDGDAQITIYPKSENESAEIRKASIKISGEGTTSTIEVTQDNGLSTVQVKPINLVTLYNQLGWELEEIGKVNKFQYLLATKSVYDNKTKKELLEDLLYNDPLKFSDGYMFFPSKDSYGNTIQPNTTYYICTLAYDEEDRRGDIVTSSVTTPKYQNADDDAWVSISDVRYNLASGFQFTATKEGYCETYHVIYGNLSSTTNYPAIAFVFEINYFLKNKKKHWFAENWDLEIVTNYPNSHTFSHNVDDLSFYPLISICTWGVFRNGKESSDAMLFRGDVSAESRVQLVKGNNEEPQNVIIKRSEEIAKRNRR